MTVRSDLAALLKPLLPKTWKIVPFAEDYTVGTHHVVMLVPQTITRAPEAPMGVLRHTYNVIVIEPKTDPEKAEDSLDDAVGQLLHAIEVTPGIGFSEATRTVWNDSNPSWDISMSVYSQKEV